MVCDDYPAERELSCRGGSVAPARSFTGLNTKRRQNGSRDSPSNFTKQKTNEICANIRIVLGHSTQH